MGSGGARTIVHLVIEFTRRHTPTSLSDFWKIVAVSASPFMPQLKVGSVDFARL